jgi:hypothetical protein
MERTLGYAPTIAFAESPQIGFWIAKAFKRIYPLPSDTASIVTNADGPTVLLIPITTSDASHHPTLVIPSEAEGPAVPLPHKQKFTQQRPDAQAKPSPAIQAPPK